MFKSFMLPVLALITIAASAEIKTSYAKVDKTVAFQPNIKTEAVDKHDLFKKEAKLDSELHPVYMGRDVTNEARANIMAPVKRDMMSDQPAPENPSTEVNRIDNVQVPNYGFVPQLHPNVAYPDIPYAPGYGYDNTYSPSNNYDVYGNNGLSYFAEPEPSAFSLIWSQFPDSRTVMGYVGRTIVWFFNSAIVLAVGSFLTVAMCSYTNLCTIAFHGVGPIHEEMRSLVTPERLEKISHAADFVKNAIDKYQQIQQVSDVARSRRSIFH